MTTILTKQVQRSALMEFSVERLSVKSVGGRSPRAGLVHFQARANAGLMRSARSEIIPRSGWPIPGQVLGHDLIVGHWPTAAYDFYWEDADGNQLRAEYVDRATYKVVFTAKVEGLDWKDHPFVAFFGKDGWSSVAA